MEGFPRYNPEVPTRLGASSLDDANVVDNDIAATAPGHLAYLSTEKARRAGRVLSEWHVAPCENAVAAGLTELQQVKNWYQYPDRLQEIFASASQVHQFQRYQLKALKQKVSPPEFQLIETALAQLKEEMLEREAAINAGQRFFRIFHGRCACNASGPRMSARPEQLSEQVQEMLAQEKQRISEQLSDMLLREAEAIDVGDWLFIQQKAQLMAYINMLADHLDHPEQIEQKIHYFTGLGFGEEQIIERLEELQKKTERIKTALSSDHNLNTHELELLELQLEELENIHGALKGNLYNLYYKGWVERSSETFDQLSELVLQIRYTRHLLVEAMGAIIEANPERLRDKIQEQLYRLVEDLKKELPESERISVIDEVLDLLESDERTWSKEKWLQLNWLCNRKGSMLRNSIPTDYPSVYHYAREFGKQLAKVAQTEKNRCRLSTSGEFESAIKEVWEEWEKHHSDQIDVLLTDPVLGDWHNGPHMEHLFKVRHRGMRSREDYLNQIKNGYLDIDNSAAKNQQYINEFYGEVIKKVAANSARFEQADCLIPGKRKLEILYSGIEQLLKQKNESGTPCFPLIQQLSEVITLDAGPNAFDLDGMILWAEELLKEPLTSSTKEQINFLFMRYRDELVKQALEK